jgi:two-component system sensor histidine kinase KdpD
MRWKAGSLAAALLRWSGMSLAALVAMTVILVPLRERLGLLDIGLFYLLYVVVVAARWGWGAGILASIEAYLVLDYFFVPPLQAIMMTRAANTIGLLTFLGVAVLTNAVLAQARASADTARRQRREMVTLNDLSRLIITEPSITTILSTLCVRVRETFSVDAVRLLLPGDGGLVPVASCGNTVSAEASLAEQRAAHEAFTRGQPAYLGTRARRRGLRLVRSETRLVPMAFVPLRVGSELVGLLQVTGWPARHNVDEDELRLLEAFAAEAALAVDRDRMLRRVTHAEALEETARLQAALLGAVSHDLRTPLASIKWSVSSLLDPSMSWDDTTRQEFLTAIDEETDRLTVLIKNLLDLSRIEAGALRPQMAWHDLREFLETTVSRLARTFTTHHLIADAPATPVETRFDYVQIGQVLANLVENAVKFAPVGTEIRVGARQRDGAIEWSVEDEGPGIPTADRARVFEKFYRRAPAGERATGIGLGLAICKGIVEAHGGRIAVEDAPGGGARVVFRLPAQSPPPPAYVPAALVTS